MRLQDNRTPDWPSRDLRRFVWAAMNRGAATASSQPRLQRKKTVKLNQPAVNIEASAIDASTRLLPDLICPEALRPSVHSATR
jgi:hypothetical protein